MNTKAARRLSAQQVLNRQLPVLAGDDVFGTEDEHTALVNIKVPPHTAIQDAKEGAIFSARYRAYGLLSKAFKSTEADSISEAQQLVYLQALRRDLGPFLTNVSATNQPKQNSAPPAGPLLNLAYKLYEKASFLPMLLHRPLKIIFRCNWSPQKTNFILPKSRFLLFHLRTRPTEL